MDGKAKWYKAKMNENKEAIMKIIDTSISEGHNYFESCRQPRSEVLNYLLEKENLYLLKEENQIHGIAVISNRHCSLLFIGKSQRNHGFGTQICEMCDSTNAELGSSAFFRKKGFEFQNPTQTTLMLRKGKEFGLRGCLVPGIPDPFRKGKSGEIQDYLNEVYENLKDAPLDTHWLVTDNRDSSLIVVALKSGLERMKKQGKILPLHIYLDKEKKVIIRIKEGYKKC